MSFEVSNLLCGSWIVDRHTPHVECTATLAEEVNALVVVGKTWIAVLALPVGELGVLARLCIIKPRITSY